MEDDFLVTEEFLNNIEIKINEAISMSKDKFVNDKLNELLKYVKRNTMMTSYDKDNLAKLINIRMKEVRSTDRDLESRYYMLYQDLVNDRISLEKAEDLYRVYVNLQEYEKRRY